MRNKGYTYDRGLTRRGVAPAGVLLALLGIWTGLIPFVGPYLNYQMQTTDTWHMTDDHFWLSLLPAVAIFVGGWLIARGFTRGAAGLGGLLTFCGGLWLIIGPTFAALWNDGAIGGGPAFGRTEVQVAEWLGFFYASGALAILLSGYALGHLASLGLVSRRLPVDAPGVKATAPATEPGKREPVAPTGDADVDAGTRAGEPRRSRFLRRRKAPTRT